MKRQRALISQLHRHLRSSTQKLHPGSPSYVRALDEALRILLKDIGSYIKKQRKTRKKRMIMGSTEDKYISDESHERYRRQVMQGRIATKIRRSVDLDMGVQGGD